MSTLVTFGYIGGPPGSPNATPVQFALQSDDEYQNGLSSSDPNIAVQPRWTLDGNGLIPLSFTECFYPKGIKPSSSTPAHAVLATRYWPAALPSGFSREELPFCVQAGQCIRVS